MMSIVDLVFGSSMDLLWSVVSRLFVILMMFWVLGGLDGSMRDI